MTPIKENKVIEEIKTPKESENKSKNEGSKPSSKALRGPLSKASNYAGSKKGAQPREYLVAEKPKERNIFQMHKNIDYSKDVLTFQIKDDSTGFIEVIGGKNSDIARREQDQREKEDSLEEQKKDHQKHSNPFKSSIKSRKSMALALKNMFIPQSITRLRWIFHAIVICILTLGSLQYFFDIIKFQKLLTNMELIYKSCKRADIFSKSVIIAQQLSFINTNTELSYFNTEDKLQELVKIMNESYDIQKYIGLSNAKKTKLH